jgi:hypothetical protein
MVLSLPQVQDLCGLMKSLKLLCPSIRLALEGRSKLHGLLPVKSNSQPDVLHVTFQTITLGDLMQKSTGSAITGRRLSQSKCYSIAFTLASSILQLLSTPWLNGRITSHDIIFLVRNGSPDVEHPYIFYKALQEPPAPMVVQDPTVNYNGTLLLYIF